MCVCVCVLVYVCILANNVSIGFLCTRPFASCPVSVRPVSFRPAPTPPPRSRPVPFPSLSRPVPARPRPALSRPDTEKSSAADRKPQIGNRNLPVVMVICRSLGVVSLLWQTICAAQSLDSKLCVGPTWIRSGRVSHCQDPGRCASLAPAEVSGFQSLPTKQKRSPALMYVSL